jgi:hypothetical protein
VHRGLARSTAVLANDMLGDNNGFCHWPLVRGLLLRAGRALRACRRYDESSVMH